MSTIKKILINKDSHCQSIWFMRQAGRYLPEFREIREKNKDFIKLCLNSNISNNTLSSLLYTKHRHNCFGHYFGAIIRSVNRSVKGK